MCFGFKKHIELWKAIPIKIYLAFQFYEDLLRNITFAICKHFKRPVYSFIVQLISTIKTLQYKCIFLQAKQSDNSFCHYIFFLFWFTDDELYKRHPSRNLHILLMQDIDFCNERPRFQQREFRLVYSGEGSLCVIHCLQIILIYVHNAVSGVYTVEPKAISFGSTSHAWL